MKIRKDDMVQVVTGNSRGKRGKVLKVFPKTNKVIVEGVNICVRHTKPNQANPQGGIIEKEAPVNASNVMVLDPKQNEPARIGAKIIINDKTGKQVRERISKKSGEML